MVTSWWGRI